MPNENPRNKLREGISNQSRFIALVLITTNQRKGIENLIYDFYIIRNSRRLDVCGASYSCDNRKDKIITLYLHHISVYLSIYLSIYLYDICIYNIWYIIYSIYIIYACRFLCINIIAVTLL